MAEDKTTEAAAGTGTLLAGARRLDPSATFEALVEWVRTMAVERGCPGLAVGLSGTDSILVFMACARAMERLGRP
jgi:NH3-dependent NAD+ synthetase